MRSLRFFFTRRWLLFLLAVAVLTVGCYWLGVWQFHRLDSRKNGNDVIRTNEHKAPVPVDSVTWPVSRRDQWQPVRATGTYDAAHTIVWRYRSDNDNNPGVEIVVPLKTSSGKTLLVDRGWMPARTDGTDPTPPAPPSGTVTVIGYLRQDGSGTSTRVNTTGSLSTRAVASKPIGEAIGQQVYGGFVDLHTENGAAPHGLAFVGFPDLGNGPHFFYGIQWWFFGVLAVVGFGWLLYDEWLLEKGDEAAEERRRIKAEQTGSRAAKLEQKRAVKAAYQAAYDRERSGERSGK